MYGTKIQMLTKQQSTTKRFHEGGLPALGQTSINISVNGKTANQAKTPTSRPGALTTAKTEKASRGIKLPKAIICYSLLHYIILSVLGEIKYFQFVPYHYSI